MIAKRPHCFLFLLLWLISGVYFQTQAQDILPQFSVKDIGSNRYVISWINNYPHTAQLTIQRSFDSIQGFKSILTVPDPNAKQNGYADTKAVNDHMFYRLYIQLEKGRYLFTTAKKPSRINIIEVPPSKPVANPDPVILQKKEEVTQTNNLSVNPTAALTAKNKANEPALISRQTATDTTLAVPATPVPPPIISKPVAIEIPVVKRLEPVVYKLQNIRLGDSAKTPLAVTTKEDPNAYAPSLFVYAHADGNIRVQVPNRTRLSRYRIKFFETDKRFLFELKNLPAPSFQLDKTNFLHGGWFLFELYEDSRLIEKHKLYLDR
ncbi:MAG: hypothetical protein FJY16_04580 [Bacteroidetes bacterium]|nr:hypothetical protein [Bacteroidota bacterium]